MEGGATSTKKDSGDEITEQEPSSSQITGAATQEQQAPTEETTSQPSPKRKIWPYIAIGATALIIILVMTFIIRKKTVHFDDIDKDPYNFDDF